MYSLLWIQGSTITIVATSCGNKLLTIGEVLYLYWVGMNDEDCVPSHAV